MKQAIPESALPLVLGSQSRSRAEIVKMLQIPFQQEPSYFREESIAFEGDPKKYVQKLSEAKGNALTPRFSNRLILTADSIVYHKGEVYGKPKSAIEAEQILALLSGHWHSLYTAISLYHAGRTVSFVEETRLLFQSLTPLEIHQFVTKVPWQENAGGYSIEGLGALLVKRMEGCFYNVLGLPVYALQELFRLFSFSLFDLIQSPSGLI